MLDLLFLIGDPKKSTTMLDNPYTEGTFTVGEALPPFPADKVSKRVLDETDSRVRVDRTS